MKDATITTLYKNKGNHGDRNNYRGISLLRITGKLFAQVILQRLQIIGEKIYPESQCGFCACRLMMI
jgi:predicted chitinase